MPSPTLTKLNKIWTLFAENASGHVVRMWTLSSPASLLQNCFGAACCTMNKLRQLRSFESFVHLFGCRVASGMWGRKKDLSWQEEVYIMWKSSTNAGACFPKLLIVSAWLEYFNAPCHWCHFTNTYDQHSILSLNSSTHTDMLLTIRYLGYCIWCVSQGASINLQESL